MGTRDREKWNRRYREDAYAERQHPSALLAGWIDRIPRGPALDIACGAGRNAVFLAANGFEVEAVDISSEGLSRARQKADAAGVTVDWIEHDLETPRDWRSDYALILVVRYVNPPLIRELPGRLAPGGYFVCEEHLRTDADVAGPTNPAFRVGAGELRAACSGLKILHDHEGIVTDPDGRSVALAQVVARR